MEIIEKYQKVYQMLEDDESKFTWINRLNYLISGDMRFMQRIIDTYLPELPLYGSRTLDDILAMIPEGRKFILFGAGQQGKAILPHVAGDKRFYGFCSSTAEKQKEGFCGYPVINPEKLVADPEFSVIISASVPDTITEILQILRDGNYPEDQIFTLDGAACSYTDQYFGPDFITYEDEEVFVDAGCYNLRTAVSLREHCKKVKKVYGFEPDMGNYESCLRNKIKYHFPEAQIYRLGTWSKQAVLHFDSGSLGSSCINDDGQECIDVTTIDETIDKDDRVTFIKMDVEGSELESLKGAKQVICRDKPKLAICIYHKPEDMTEIPLYIKSLVPEYKIYVRHHSNYETETVLYAVMPK